MVSTYSIIMVDQDKAEYELKILLLAEPNVDHPKLLTLTSRMPLRLILRLEPALLLVAFTKLDLAVTVATLPPTSVALAELTVALAPFGVLVASAVVGGATALAKAFKIFPIDAHLPVLLSNPT